MGFSQTRTIILNPDAASGIQDPDTYTIPLKNMTLYFATGNPAKVTDFEPVFAKAGLILAQIPKLIDVEENAPTLLANAKLKALANSEQYPDELIVGNDGGVKIPHLGQDWDHLLTKRLSGKDMQRYARSIHRETTRGNLA